MRMRVSTCRALTTILYRWYKAECVCRFAAQHAPCFAVVAFVDIQSVPVTFAANLVSWVASAGFNAAQQSPN